MKKNKIIALLSLLLIFTLILPTACAPSEKADDKAKDVKVSEAPAKEDDKKEEKSEEAKEKTAYADIESSATNQWALKAITIKGPTGMGLAPILKEEKEAGDIPKLTIDITEQPTDVSQAIIEGQAYMAAMPSNMAAIANTKIEGGLKILAINTVGNIHLYGRDKEVKNLEALKDKTIYLSGKGGTPEYVLREVLKQAGLDAEKDLKLEFKATHAESVAALEKDEAAVALLPQPFATVAVGKIENLDKIIDLNEVWAEYHPNSAIITGVIAIRNDVLEIREPSVKDFLERYKESIEKVNKNPADAAKLIEEFDILKADIAEKAIPESGIQYIDGKEMQEKLTAFYNVLHEQNPETVGGEVPAEDIFYLP